MTNADIVFFAIRGAIRIGRQIKEASIDRVIRKPLVLPLPEGLGSNYIHAAKFFSSPEGATLMPVGSRIEALVDRFNIDPMGLSDAEEAELYDLYRDARGLEETSITIDEIQGIMTIRQWEKGADAFPSPFQRIAGTLVETGIDYYLNVPGALDADSAKGKAVRSFLSGLEKVDFSEDKLGKIAPQLMIALAETLEAHPGLLSDHEATQEFVKQVTAGLAKDLEAQLAKPVADLSWQANAGRWGKTVYTSLLANGSRIALSDPKKFLGIDSSQDADLVRMTGTALLQDAVTKQGIKFERLFAKDSMDRVTKATFAFLGENPGYLGINIGNAVNQDAFNQIVGNVFKELSTANSVFRSDFFPEAFRLVLRKTSDNLPQLLIHDPNSPESLVIAALKETLAVFGKEPQAGESWPNFTRDDLVSIADAAIDELVGNHEWLLKKFQNKTAIRRIFEQTLEVLGKYKDTGYLKREVSIEILRTSLKAAALRESWMKRFPHGSENAGRSLVTHAIDAVLDSILGDPNQARAAAALVKAEALQLIMNAVFAKLSEAKVTEAKINALKTIITDAKTALQADQAFSLNQLITDIEAATLA